MVTDDQSERLVMMVDVARLSFPAFATDSRRHIVLWNAQAEELLGYCAYEATGRPCHLMFGQRDRASPTYLSACESCTPARHTCPEPETEIPIAAKSGELKWISMRTFKALTAGGDLYTIHVLCDHTAHHPLDNYYTPRADELFSVHLTKREGDALRLLAQGLNTTQIASSLGVSRVTARNHVTRVMEKLDARTRLQAVIIAAQLRLI